MKIFSHKFKNSGETLVEVLISVVVLTTVLTSAFMVLSRAVRANVDVKNRVIAINIARDGIEAVRNIRDSNWLRFSGDRRNKWLCIDDDPDCGEKMGDGEFYVIEFKDEDNDTETPEEFVLTNILNAKALDLKIENLGEFTSFRLYKDNLTGRFTYADEDGDGNKNEQSLFYRQIQLKLEAVDAPSGGNEKLMVVSKVGWLEESQHKEVALETHLYDFYERDSY